MAQYQFVFTFKTSEPLTEEQQNDLCYNMMVQLEDIEDAHTVDYNFITQGE
jgi:hypothetical protein